MNITSFLALGLIFGVYSIFDANASTPLQSTITADHSYHLNSLLGTVEFRLGILAHKVPMVLIRMFVQPL